MTRNHPLGGAAAVGAKRLRNPVTIARPEVLDKSKAALAQRMHALREPAGTVASVGRYAPGWTSPNPNGERCGS